MCVGRGSKTPFIIVQSRRRKENVEKCEIQASNKKKLKPNYLTFCKSAEVELGSRSLENSWGWNSWLQEGTFSSSCDWLRFPNGVISRKPGLHSTRLLTDQRRLLRGNYGNPAEGTAGPASGATLWTPGLHLQAGLGAGADVPGHPVSSCFCSCLLVPCEYHLPDTSRFRSWFTIAR